MCLGIPGQIIAKQANDTGTMLGTISYGGVTKEVSLAFVPEAEIGDYVIIHAGFAISQIDEQEAQETLALLRQVAELAGRDDEEGAQEVAAPAAESSGGG